MHALFILRLLLPSLAFFYFEQFLSVSAPGQPAVITDGGRGDAMWRRLVISLQAEEPRNIVPSTNADTGTSRLGIVATIPTGTYAC